MAQEIERKYLVTDDRWRALPLLGVRTIRQGYLPKGQTVRLDFSNAASYGFEFNGAGQIVAFAVPANETNADFKTMLSHPAYNAETGIFTAGNGTILRIRSAKDEAGQKAYLTIKHFSGSAESKDEHELEIPYDEAQIIMETMCEDFVSKLRHLVEHEGHVWEVDVFKGKLKGLVVAELEVSDAALFENIVTLPGAEENVTEHPKMGNRDLGRSGIPKDIARKLSL